MLQFGILKLRNKAMTAKDMSKRYESLIGKINYNAKDILKEINDKLSLKEQQFIVKNSRLYNLQKDYEKQGKSYPCNRVIISEKNREVVASTNTVLTFEDYLELPLTHTSYETFLILRGYKVIHSLRDLNEDKENGFVFFILKIGNTYHIHIAYISSGRCQVKDLVYVYTLEYISLNDAINFTKDLGRDINNLAVNKDDYNEIVECVRNRGYIFEEYIPLSEKYKNKYPALFKNAKTFDIVTILFIKNNVSLNHLIVSLTHIEELSSYYDFYKKIDNLEDYRVYSNNRFHDCQNDIIIEVTE